jgi:hypothetical protein
MSFEPRLPHDATMRVEKSHVPALSAMLTRAFTDEPLVTWIIPEIDRRVPFLARLFHLTLDQYLPAGHVFAFPDCSGVAIASPPGASLPGDADAFEDLRVSLPMAAQERLAAVNAALRQARPVAEHYYFAFVGVEPGQHHQGAGGILVRRCLATPEASSALSYAEAGNPLGMALMVRNGFEQARPPAPVGPHGLVFLMRNPPGVGDS